MHLIILLTTCLTYAATLLHAAQTAADYRTLGDTLYYGNKLNDALDAYNQLITLEPTQINYFQRASTYIKLRDFDAAITDLTAAIQSDTQFLKGYISRIKIYKITGQCNLALHDIDTVLQQNDKHKQALIERNKVQQCISLQQRAQQQIQAKQYTQAKHTLNELLDIAIDSDTILLQKCEINLQLHDYDSVLLDTRTLLQRNKNNLDALLVRGNAFYEMGEHDNALNHYKEALKQDPEHHAIKTQYKQLKHLTKLISDADAYATNKQHSDAIQSYIDAIAIKPNHDIVNKELYSKLAQQYIDTKQGQHAIDAINHSIRVDNNNNAYIRIRAEAYILLEQYQNAINDYTACLSRDQTARDCQNGLNTAQTLLKRSTEIDYYKVLDLPRTADTSEIKKQYRKLAMLYHPDKHADATEEERALNEEKFKSVADAYDVLSTPELRERYDRGEDVKAGVQQNTPQQHYQQQQHFHHPFGNFGGFGQQQHYSFRFG